MASSTSRDDGPSRRSAEQLRRLVRPGHLAAFSLVVASLVYLIGARNLWFFGDEWAFIVDRRSLWADGDRFAYLFDPHNEHLSTIPVIINGAVFSLVGLNSYVAYMVPVIAAHVAVCVLLWKLLLRLDVNAWVAAISVSVFAFFGSGAENLTWGFQIGFVGAVALGLGQLLLADHDGRLGWRDAAAAVLGCLGVLTVGVAVTMVATVGLVLVLRRRYVAAAVQTLPAATIYVVWYVGYGSDRVSSFPRDASQIPPYVVNGMAATFDAIVQLPPTGLGIGLVLLLAMGARFLGSPDRLVPVVAMAVGALLFFVINGYGRVALGPEQARGSRYMYVAGVLLLPLVTIGVDALRRRRPSLALVLVLLAAWSGIANLSAYYAVRNGHMSRVAPARDRIEAAAVYAASGVTGDGLIPEPTYSAPVSMSVLKDLVDSGQFDVDTSKVSEQSLLQAGLDLGVTVGNRPDEEPGTGELRVDRVEDATIEATAEGCVYVVGVGPNPRVVFVDGDAGTLDITTSEPVVYLYLRGSDGAEVPKEIPAIPGGRRWLSIDVLVGEPVVGLSPGAGVTICGVGELP